MGLLDPYGSEKPGEVHNDFDLFQELSRGALYRGGQDAATWMLGYRLGIFFMLGVVVSFWFFSMIS